MSFSWWCKDREGKDLFEEFQINSQALRLADETCPRSVSEIRSAWTDVQYKDKLEDAARDAMAIVRIIVLENLEHYTEPAHPECPSCQCRRHPPEHFGMDIEQAQRFVTIPLERVWRAGGGY